MRSSPLEPGVRLDQTGSGWVRLGQAGSGWGSPGSRRICRWRAGARPWQPRARIRIIAENQSQGHGGDTQHTMTRHRLPLTALRTAQLRIRTYCIRTRNTRSELWRSICLAPKCIHLDHVCSTVIFCTLHTAVHRNGQPRDEEKIAKCSHQIGNKIPQPIRRPCLMSS